MTPKVTVLCFPNGNVTVCKDGEQVPEAQDPWILSVAGNLNKVGIDPLDAEVWLPTGKRAEFFRTSDGGLNWRVL